MIVSGMAAHAQNSIERVSSSTQSDVEVLRIELTQPISVVPKGFIIPKPARIAIDFPGIASSVGRAAVEINQPTLRSVNVVQAGERSRVVLNLNQMTVYRVEIQGNSLLVILEPTAAPHLTAPEAEISARENDRNKRPSRNAGMGPTSDAAPGPGSASITLNFSNADVEDVARTMAVVTGRNVVVDPRVKGIISLITDRAIPPAAAFNQFTAALRLQGFAVMEADGLYKVVPEADAKLQSSAVNTSIGAAAKAGSNQIVTQIFQLTFESPSNLVPVLRPLIPPNNTINANPGNNSLVITDYADNMRRLARIITALDVPNASDIEVIQLKHSVANDLLPLVLRLLDGSGSGSAPSAAAPGTADASFRTTLLADQRSNSLILRAANLARARLVRTLVEKLDRSPVESSNGAAGNIYVVYLKNADAVRLAATLRAAMAANQPTGTSGGQGGGASMQQGGAAQVTQAGLPSGQGGTSSAGAPLNNANQPSTGGQIQADPSTNSLIITAPEPQYRQMRAVIDKLDGRRAQVMVEALIVEVSARKAANFGVQWQSALSKNALAGTNSSLTGANILALTQAIAAKTLPTVAPGLNLAIAGKIGGEHILGVIANFFTSDGDANVLSTPNLLTLDNEEAKIVIGQNVPFVTGQYASTSGSAGINPFTTVERKDVGLTLRVRPTINENGTVKLVISQETSTVDQQTVNSPNGPTTSKRSIESSVLVEDGGLVMLGGLLSDNYGSTVEKVPLAGDIPVVGNLFKNEVRTRDKSNLMMFLRPVVMRDGRSTETFAWDRYDEIRGMQQRAQPSTDNVMLRAVSSAPVLAEAPSPRSSSRNPGEFRLRGTQLIPPPRLADDAGMPAQSLLRGALPPTADPASQRELP
ncbi:type II secretion system protein D (GspD) [Variovorax sp. 54]|nr:type II secretion system protein D (GspD) [Variovorax sp. 54]